MEIQALAVLWVQFPLSPLGRGIPTCRYSEPTLTARKDGHYVKMENIEVKEILKGIEKAIAENNPMWVCYEIGIAVQRLEQLINIESKVK